MIIKRLDHVNIRTGNLETMIVWYQDILGLKPGYRPDFKVPGAWLYVGDDPVVHLVGIEDDNGVGSEVDLKLEHFAFSAEREDAFLIILEKNNEKFSRSTVLGTNIVQYNIWDPDGNHIHIDFVTVTS